jgi:hypothetical protein
MAWTVHKPADYLLGKQRKEDLKKSCKRPAPLPLLLPLQRQ